MNRRISLLLALALLALCVMALTVTAQPAQPATATPDYTTATEQAKAATAEAMPVTFTVYLPFVGPCSPISVENCSDGTVVIGPGW